MVYKRYIKRGGKVCGPYYYESYRNKDGKVISKYLKNYKLKFRNKIFIKVLLNSSLIFLIAIFFLITFHIDKSYIKITGFSIYDPPNQSWNTTGPAGTAYGIAVDNNGRVFVTGESGSDYYTIKYDAANGSQVWNVSYNGGADDKAYGVSADNQGFIYLTGVADIDGNYATFKYNSTNGS